MATDAGDQSHGFVLSCFYSLKWISLNYSIGISLNGCHPPAGTARRMAELVRRLWMPFMDHFPGETFGDFRRAAQYALHRTAARNFIRLCRRYLWRHDSTMATRRAEERSSFEHTHIASTEQASRLRDGTFGGQAFGGPGDGRPGDLRKKTRRLRMTKAIGQTAPNRLQLIGNGQKWDASDVRAARQFDWYPGNRFVIKNRIIDFDIRFSFH